MQIQEKRPERWERHNNPLKFKPEPDDAAGAIKHNQKLLDWMLIQGAGMVWIDADKIKNLLDKGANPNARINGGESALMEAAEYARADVCSLLLEKGADVDGKNSYKDTPLMRAAAAGLRDTVLLLLEHGARINARNRAGETALMLAIKDNHRENIETVRLLVEHGAKVNARSGNRMTALLDAASYRHARIAEFLLEHGADANATDCLNQTALTHVTNENSELFQMLKDAESMQKIVGLPALGGFLSSFRECIGR
jgi:ankyrin repeat protein